jgi:CheY-like chemotaxis protein
MANGSGLSQALAGFQPHLIWLDVKLSDVDGYTLLEQLQQSPHWQHIPVIIVTALASNPHSALKVSHSDNFCH